jgi:hypothetical protein
MSLRENVMNEAISKAKLFIPFKSIAQIHWAVVLMQRDIHTGKGDRK